MKHSKPILSVFFISLLFWGYLLLTSQMIVVHDSLEYESLGQLLAQHPWIEYFKTGPNREPLYPLFIATAMRLSELFQVHYQITLKFMQIGLLCLTQYLTLILLNLMRVRVGIQALTIAYIGFSPSLVNSALSLYSEILCCPLVPAIILVSYKTWQGIQDPQNPSQHCRFVLDGILLGLVFLLICFVKINFQLIAQLFCVVLAGYGLMAWRRKNTKTFNRSLFVLGGFALTFFSVIFLYQWANKIHNGNFVRSNTLLNRCLFSLFLGA